MSQLGLVGVRTGASVEVLQPFELHRRLARPRNATVVLFSSTQILNFVVALVQADESVLEGHGAEIQLLRAPC